LLSTGLQLAREGTLDSYRPTEERELIKSVKRGAFTLDEITEMSEDLMSELKIAMDNTSLPEKVDKVKVNRLMVHTINEMNCIYMHIIRRNND
jgi:polyhydroxyalkanoate synthesis regulator phasin